MKKKYLIKTSCIFGLWGLISSLISIDNIRHTETLWWFSGSIFEKVVLFPAYITNLIGNPFVPILRWEGVVVTSLQAKMWHIGISTLIGILIGTGISIVVSRYIKDTKITKKGI